MKTLGKKMALKLKAFFKLGRRKVIDVDLLVEENLQLMKEIRMHRIRFYKYYRKAIS